MSEPYSQLAEGQRAATSGPEIQPCINDPLVCNCQNCRELRDNAVRHSGPMAATVDKVLRRFSDVPDEWRFVRVSDLNAAIRRAADTSAKEIWDNLKVSKDAVTCYHHKAMMETFERHIRQELGL